MKIVNERLVEVSENDVNDGVLNISEGVQVINPNSIKNLKSLRIIKFGDCVKIVNGSAISNCPNLEKIDFDGYFDRIGGAASTTDEIGLAMGSSIFSGCPKLKLDGIKFTYKDFDIGKNFLGDKTLDYIDQTAKSVERYFSSQNNLVAHNTSFDLRMIAIAHKLMQTGVFYSAIKKDTFNSMNKKIVEYLNTEKNGKRVGDELMKYVLERDILIPFPLLQYEAYRECEKNKTPFQCIESTNTGAKGLLREEDGVVEMYYNSIIKSEKDNRNKNIRLLFVIRHELTHLKQRYARADSSDIRERLSHIDCVVPTLADGYQKGHNFKGHDLLSNEIDADLNAYNSLMDDLRGRLRCSVSRDIMKNVYERRNERIKKAFCVDEDGVPKYKDYRAAMYTTLMSSCSPTEKARLQKSYNEYLALRLEAARKGINLYPELARINQAQNR